MLIISSARSADRCRPDSSQHFIKDVYVTVSGRKEGSSFFSILSMICSAWNGAILLRFTEETIELITVVKLVRSGRTSISPLSAISCIRCKIFSARIRPSGILTLDHANKTVLNEILSGLTCSFPGVRDFSIILSNISSAISGLPARAAILINVLYVILSGALLVIENIFCSS